MRFLLAMRFLALRLLLLAIGCLLRHAPGVAQPMTPAGELIPQGMQAEENLRALASGSPSSYVQTYDNRFAGVMGSPFLFESWVRGELWTPRGKHIDALWLNYDAYEGKLAFLLAGQPMLASEAQVDRFVLFPDEQPPMSFVKREAPRAEPGSQRHGFYEPLHKGESHWLLAHRKELIMAEPQLAYSSGNTYDEFVYQARIHRILPQGGHQLLAPRKKDFLRAFPRHKSAIKTFLKQHDVDWASTAFLKALVQFCDQL